MKTRIMLALAGSALTVLILGGCAGATPASTTDDSPSAAPEPAAEIATSDSSLGSIVVDGKGMTAYYFDKDVADSGESSCTGDCLVAWPPIVSETTTPVVDGVTGKVGTIKDAAGDNQVTIDGLPIYTYAKDAAAGDVVGQGVGGVWWVVAPDGNKITTPLG